MNIADIAVVQSQVGRAIDGTALATTIGITLDSRHTVVETVVDGDLFLVRTDTDDHMRLAWSFIVIIEGSRFPVGTDSHRGIAHVALPASAIDVTYRTTGNKGIGTGSEARRVAIAISADTEEVVYTSGSTCRINVFTDGTTKQCNVC